MTIKAKIVGPADELGPIPDGGLSFFGHRLDRDWTEINPRPDVLEKLRGNRHVEVSGGPKAEAGPAPAPASASAPNKKAPAPMTDEETAVRAELADLGVEAKPDTSLKVLKMALGKAKKAHAAAT